MQQATCARTLHSSLRQQQRQQQEKQPHPALDTIVVGGGVFGASAAVALAKRGQRTLLVDQHHPGHDNGSSHGDGRIYRLAYREKVYIDMMRLALRGWDELEAYTGKTLRARTGGLDISEHGDESLSTLVESYKQHGIAFDELDAEKCNARFPQFSLKRGQAAVYQADAGVLFATKAVLALWQAAAQLGVQTASGTAVTSFEAAEKRADGLCSVSMADGTQVRPLLDHISTIYCHCSLFEFRMFFTQEDTTPPSTPPSA